MKLPPLKALVYFNAAAEHMSFKAAALDMHVTEGAVSRQIKLLEQYHGQLLFERVGRGVRLTDTGRRLLSVSEHAMRQISQVSEEICGYAQQFTLSVTTSFAIRWLLPRLADFEAKQPNYPINLQTRKNPREIPGIRFDASIIYVLGNPFTSSASIPENSHFIMAEWLVPVCSPMLLADAKCIPLSSLEQFRLIFNEPTGRDWRLWLESVPEAKVHCDTALRFEHDDTAIQAAVAGHGIALANLAYIENELKMGSLVPAVDQTPIAIGAHYLISEPDRAELAHVMAFTLWLKETVNET